MMFWIGIFIAVAFAASSLKLGLYHAWTLLFNMLIAVYLGIRIGPFIVEFIPASGDYNATLAILAAAVVPFLILHGISFALLIGQFDVTFPRSINKIGSAIFGFLTGFLVWSFILLLVCTTPLIQNKFFKDVGVSREGFEQIHTQGYLAFWCSAIDKVVGTADTDSTAKQTITGLLNKGNKAGVLPAQKGQSAGTKAGEPNINAVPFRQETIVPRETNDILPP